jgi:hypothetical protein
MANGGADDVRIALEGGDETGLVEVGAVGDDGIGTRTAGSFARDTHFIEGAGFGIVATADGMKVGKTSDEPPGGAGQPIDGGPEADYPRRDGKP